MRSEQKRWSQTNFKNQKNLQLENTCIKSHSCTKMKTTEVTRVCIRHSLISKQEGYFMMCGCFIVVLLIWQLIWNYFISLPTIHASEHIGATVTVYLLQKSSFHKIPWYASCFLFSFLFPWTFLIQKFRYLNLRSCLIYIDFLHKILYLNFCYPNIKIFERFPDTFFNLWSAA